MRYRILTDEQTGAYRGRLQAIVARLGNGVNGLRDEALRPVGAEEAGAAAGDADHGARVADTELALDLLAPEEGMLVEATAALARLDAGTFGRCKRCGEPIARARLDALPYARHCVRCARKAEAAP